MEMSSSAIHRSLLGGLCLAILTLALVNFTHLTSSPHDENLFANAPSRIYVTRAFPARPSFQKQDSSKSVPFQSVGIQVGDLIVSVDRQRVVSLSEFERVMDKIHPFSVFNLEVFRPRTNQFIAYSVSASMVPDDAFRSIPHAVNVIQVFSGGASDRAGMRAGDLIVRINGKTFSNALEADQIMRRTRAGRTVNYEVLRQNQLTTLRVTMAKFGIPASLLVLKVGGLIFLAFGCFLWASRPLIKAARINGMGFSLLGGGMALFVPNGIYNYIPAERLIDLICWALLLFGTASLIHGRYYFPNERPNLLSRTLYRAVPYWLALFAWIAASILGKHAVLPGMLLLIAYQIAIILIIRAPKGQTRTRQALFLNGVTAICVAQTVPFFFLRGPWVNSFGYVSVLLLLLPATYFYVIARHGLLNLRIRLRRNIQYSVLSFLWVALIFIGFLFLLKELPKREIPIPNLHVSLQSIEVLESPLSSEQHRIQERKVLMLVAIVLAFLGFKVGTWGQHWIDQKFHQTPYDYRRGTSELADVLGKNLSLDDLGKKVAAKLAEMMYLKRVGVLFFKPQEDACFHQSHGTDRDEWDRFCRSQGRDLVGTVGQFYGEISSDYMPHAIKGDLRRLGIEYLIPIRSKAQLLGCIMVGGKLSEAAFQQEDLRFIVSATQQIAVSIENAFLYRQLAQQERLKHELEIARRIQLSSLPQYTPEIPGLEISGISIPAQEVGGDCFDYLEFSDGITVVVGDVSGKGTSAALLMSKFQGILRALFDQYHTPRQLLSRMNPILIKDMDAQSFVTALCATFFTDRSEVQVSRAGHLPLFHYCGKTGQVVRINPPGMGLGLDNSGKFEAVLDEVSTPYHDGDVFLFLSDGVSEACNHSGDLFGEAPFEELLRAHHQEPAEAIRSLVLTQVTAFSGETERQDDQTVVVVRVCNTHSTI